MGTELTIKSLSDQFAAVVERAGKSVVRIDDGSRLTASGLVWSADGLILTTSHGTERDEDLIVVTASGERLEATLIGRDDESDLALLRVDASNLTPLDIGDESSLKIGQLALALGTPGTAGLQATLGIVGSKQEMTSGGRVEYLIGSDATLYPGFSGGPLVDVNGRLLGINNRAFGRGQTIAIGATLATHVVESLVSQGTVKRGYLGVSTQAVALPENLRANLAIEQRVGLLVVQVAENGPAESAGLTLGDTILKVDERPLADVDQLRSSLRGTPPGQSISLQIVRGGEARDLAVVLGSVS